MFAVNLESLWWQMLRQSLWFICLFILRLFQFNQWVHLFGWETSILSLIYSNLRLSFMGMNILSASSFSMTNFSYVKSAWINASLSGSIWFNFWFIKSKLNSVIWGYTVYRNSELISKVLANSEILFIVLNITKFTINLIVWNFLKWIGAI